ncbi:MAG: dioxygenase [Macromonas bipunctata]|uniref:dioxygenase family protein n=1 Tax=Macromonas bipunctata TaxID=183670 RepID=UPI000C3416B8|nr:dioxygenase [Macromonas bipunctata]MBP6753632.1 catechol 1,2-dioxygenase [Alicycliphilus sp.]MDD2535541.1 dioxygenase [Macromonas bipunctata]
MTKNEYTKEQLLERVNTIKINEGNPRARAIITRITADLFKAIDELKVTPDEFWAACDWLTRLGQTGQVGLITAGLGFDRLLDIMMDEADEAAGIAAGTPRAIEGPLYVAGAPKFNYEAQLDDDSTLRGTGKVLVMEGTVYDHEGNPVAGAEMDAWHCNEKGGYSHFFPGMKDHELRRKIVTNEKGQYRFRTTIAPGYEIPPSGPTHELFAVLGRHGIRPAHIHFHIVKPGHRTLTTQVNTPGDAYIDDDFAFATREALVLNLEENVAPAGYESLGINAPFVRAKFDFKMQQAVKEDDTDPRTRVAKALNK